MGMKVLAILLVILAAGCVTNTNTTNTTKPTSEADQAKDACIQACLAQKGSGQDLSQGPCLSNSITKDYVCDVAHNPRTEMDNERQNQCPAYPGVPHFVEVDPECGFIRAG